MMMGNEHQYLKKLLRNLNVPLRTTDVWGGGGVRWGGKGMKVENEQRCEDARTRSLELVGCGFESWLCHMLELCDAGQIISILSPSFAIFIMSIFILTL